MLASYEINKLETIIYIFAINSIFALIYFIIKCIKKDISRGIIMSIFMILCPIVGPLYLFLSRLVYEIYFKRRGANISIEELSLRKEKIEVILKPDMISALNKVPLEEALMVSDKESVRKLLLDVLREDSSGSVKAILKALEHKDSEVTHYAASAISDIIHEFKLKEKQLREEFGKDKDNIELSERYVDYLYNFLSQNILSTAEQKRYCNLFEELVITIEENLPSETSGELYNKLVIALLDIEEQDRAKIWVDKAIINNGNELDSYKAGLRYYYNFEDKSEFLTLLDKLKKSNVPLNHDTLDMVRFFSH